MELLVFRRRAPELRASTASFLIIVFGLITTAAALIMLAGRETTFRWDEWDFIEGSRVGGPEVLLAPHNGHLSVVPILIYRALFAVVGLRQYAPYRVTLLVLHVACCVLFLLIARRRVGRVMALLMMSLLLFLGTGWNDLISPFQITFLLSLVAGLFAFVLLEHWSHLNGLVASAALVIAVGSSGVGIPFVAATAVWNLSIKERWSRIWIVVAPVLLYSIWYMGYGAPQAVQANLPHVPLYMIRSAGGALGGLSGVGTDLGMLLLIFAVAFLSLRLAQASLSPSMAAFLSLAATFWFLTGLTRANLGDADASRYIYPGALFCLLIAAEALAGSGFRPEFLFMVGLLTAGAVALNTIALIGAGNGLRASTVTVRAELAAVEIAAPVVKDDFQPDQVLMPQVIAGPYLRAVAALGSPADSQTEILLSPETVRTSTDHVLQRAERLELTGTSSGYTIGSRPTPDDPNLAQEQDGQCILVRDASSGATFTSPPAGLLIRSETNAPIHVQLRRFADAFDRQAIPVSGSGPQFVLRLGADHMATPWHVIVLAAGPVRICGLGA